MKQPDGLKRKGKIRVLRLERETLRELGTGELRQALGGDPRTSLCSTERRCTHRCASVKRC